MIDDYMVHLAIILMYTLGYHFALVQILQSGSDTQLALGCSEFQVSKRKMVVAWVKVHS
jgi:hypothetical protein